MGIVKAGAVLGFSSDGLSTALQEKFAEIGKFIPKVGVAAASVGKTGAGPGRTVSSPGKSDKFVDGFRDGRARALANAGAPRSGAVARSRQSYVSALKNRARSLPTGAVESVAQVIINAVRAGGDSLNTVTEMYRACFLDACNGVTQTVRGDFQDDNKGVA